jgi:hypothetical protein
MKKRQRKNTVDVRFASKTALGGRTVGFRKINAPQEYKKAARTATRVRVAKNQIRSSVIPPLGVHSVNDDRAYSDRGTAEGIILR